MQLLKSELMSDIPMIVIAKGWSAADVMVLSPSSDEYPVTVILRGRTKFATSLSKTSIDLLSTLPYSGSTKPKRATQGVNLLELGVTKMRLPRQSGTYAAILTCDQ